MMKLFRFRYPILFLSLLWLVLVVWQQRPTAASGENRLYLPFLVWPGELQPSPEVLLQITPNWGLQGSTFNPGSFLIYNLPGHDKAISRMRIDLSTAIFPDMLFDPFGQAGDVVAKDVEVDGGHDVGYQGRVYDQPRDGGFEVLELNFGDFTPGEHFIFSVDVDPSSIRGTNVPGPGNSGSVSGLELAGSTVTVTFADQTTLTGFVYRQGESLGGGEALIRDALPAAPQVEVLGIPALPATTNNPYHTLRITKGPWRGARVLVVEGALFENSPGSGYNVGPYEANSAVYVQEYDVPVSMATTADLPVTLTRVHEAAGGYNYILVVPVDNFGVKGVPAPTVVLRLDPAAP
jgi:hypothetical protein